jgi:hypothetical protein
MLDSFEYRETPAKRTRDGEQTDSRLGKATELISRKYAARSY